MNKPGKILLFIAALAGLGFSVALLSLFYNLPFITDTVRRYQALFPYLNDIFAGYIAFICLLFFLLLPVLLLIPNKSNDLLLQKNRGRLLFSKQTVESTVRYSFADVDGINFSKVGVRLGRLPEKTRIYVKLSLSDSSEMVGLTEMIQDKIETALKSSLGIAVKSINIKVAEFNPNSNAARKETALAAAKDSRVI